MTDKTPADPAVPALTSNTRQTNWRRANLLKYSAHLAVRRALGPPRSARATAAPPPPGG